MKKPDLYITVGISGSGKTTFCSQFISYNPNFVYISLDKIHNSPYFVRYRSADVALTQIDQALRTGHNVLFDANNCVSHHRCKIIGRIDLDLDDYNRYAILFKVSLLKSLFRRVTKLGFWSVIRSYFEYKKDLTKLYLEPYIVYTSDRFILNNEKIKTARNSSKAGKEGSS